MIGTALELWGDEIASFMVELWPFWLALWAVSVTEGWFRK